MARYDPADRELADRVQDLIAQASEMPVKSNGLGRRGSLKEAVVLAYVALKDLKNKGYNDAELVSVMSAHGFAINAGTLRNYMAWAGRQNVSLATNSTPRATRFERAAAAASVVMPSVVTANAALATLGVHPISTATTAALDIKPSLGHRLHDNDL